MTEHIRDLSPCGLGRLLYELGPLCARCVHLPGSCVHCDEAAALLTRCRIYSLFSSEQICSLSIASITLSNWSKKRHRHLCMWRNSVVLLSQHGLPHVILPIIPALAWSACADSDCVDLHFICYCDRFEQLLPLELILALVPTYCYPVWLVDFLAPHSVGVPAEITACVVGVNKELVYMFGRCVQ